MTEKQMNIERGRQEIQRRKKLLVASIFLLIPYCLLIVVPVGHFLNGWLSFFYAGLFLFCLYRLNKNFRKLPCPNCGNAILTPMLKPAVGESQCVHCGLDLKPAAQAKRGLSFSPIIYKPGDGK